MSRHDNQIAWGVAFGLHAVLFLVFVLGGFFSFLQSHSQPPPVDVTVYNENAADTPTEAANSQGRSAAGGSNGGGGETYAVPTTAMPEINETYTQAAQTERAVQEVMKTQQVDAATAKQIVAKQQIATQASPTGQQQGPSTVTSKAGGSAAGPGNNPNTLPGNSDTSSDTPGNADSAGTDQGTDNHTEQQGKRPAQDAKLLSYPDVSAYYPEALRRRGISGSVTLHIVVGADGTVQEAKVIESSGYPEMDAAAVQVGYQLRFEPAVNENGQPVASEGDQRIPFGFRKR